jgi:hypothetical protein
MQSSLKVAANGCLVEEKGSYVVWRPLKYTKQEVYHTLSQTYVPRASLECFPRKIEYNI